MSESAIPFVRPEHDAPRCPDPKCNLPCATPPRNWWDVRPDYTYHAQQRGHSLYCPACGMTWAGSNEDNAQAERSLQAWERKDAEERRRERERFEADRAMAPASPGDREESRT